MNLVILLSLKNIVFEILRLYGKTHLGGIDRNICATPEGAQRPRESTYVTGFGFKFGRRYGDF